MKVRVVAVHAVALAACLLTIGAACSSTDEPSSTGETTKAPTSTSTATEKPNSIPFAVGVPVGLPNGWLVQITDVHRPYSNTRLPELDDGREYVAVGISIENRGTEAHTVDAAKLFELGDSTRKLNRVVAVGRETNDLDGSYAPQTRRSGRLVFDVPTQAALRLAMIGPLIGTKYAIFSVDPPTAPPSD